MTIVLDASAAVEIAMDRGKAAKLADEVDAAGSVLSPDLVVAEVLNAAWKYHRFHNLGQDDCDRIVERAFRLIDEFVPANQLYREALLLARTIRKPVYDMFYLALARREQATLLTLDATFKKEAERQGIPVI